MIEGEFSSPEYHCTHSSQDLMLDPELWGFDGASALVTDHEVLVEGSEGKTVIPLIEYCSWKQFLGSTESQDPVDRQTPDDVLNIVWMGGGAAGSIENVKVLFNMLPAFAGRNIRITIVPQIHGVARTQKKITPESAARIIHSALQKAELDKTDIFGGHSAAGTYGPSLINKLEPKTVLLIDPTGIEENKSLVIKFAQISKDELLNHPHIAERSLIDRAHFMIAATLASFLTPQGRTKVSDIVFAYTIGLFRATRVQRKSADKYGFRSRPIALDVEELTSRQKSYDHLTCETLIVVNNAFSRVVRLFESDYLENSELALKELEAKLHDKIKGPNKIKAAIYTADHNAPITDPYFWGEIAPILFEVNES
jgi:hypothetical protein